MGNTNLAQEEDYSTKKGLSDDTRLEGHYIAEAAATLSLGLEFEYIKLADRKGAAY